MFDHCNKELIHRDEDQVFSKELWNESIQYLLSSNNISSKSVSLNFLDLHQKFITLSENNDDNGLVFSLHAHFWGGLFPILKFAPQQLKERYLLNCVKGSNICSLAYTDCKESPLTCINLPDGSFKLVGKKKYITNAPIADLFIVYAKTDEQKMNAFILQKESVGLFVGNNINMAGLKTSPIAHLEFVDCIVGKNSLLGEIGDGALIFNSCIEKERLFIMSSLLGRLHKLKNNYLAVSTKNKLLAHYPNIETLSHIQNAILISHSILDRGIRILENGENAFLLSAQAKVIIAPLYQEVCRRIIQSLGAAGLEQIEGFERENRDALASTLYSGSIEVLHKLIAAYSKH